MKTSKYYTRCFLVVGTTHKTTETTFKSVLLYFPVKMYFEKNCIYLLFKFHKKLTIE